MKKKEKEIKMPLVKKK